MAANRDYNPALYDRYYREGAEAAARGEERRAPTTFQYEYAADCWFDGYDHAVIDRASKERIDQLARGLERAVIVMRATMTSPVCHPHNVIMLKDGIAKAEEALAQS